MVITYLCPLTRDHPIGGVKVMYKHAEILARNGVQSFVFHPDDPSFRGAWFGHDVPFRQSKAFDPATDFIVIPEIWAGIHARACRDNGLKYAIFVQNPYSIHFALQNSAAADLARAYHDASFLLSISEDTTSIIALAYPDVPREKILRLRPHVSDAFHIGTKAKVISFMPRKLRDHAERLLFLLKPHLAPHGWEIVAIDKKTEGEVADILARSSIFLSFCDQEGFGLPPLEAALSGALVVGYTGQGAKEYFRAPNFRAVENGDYRSFVEHVRQAMGEVDAGILASAPFLAGISKLKAEYSRANELDRLLTFAEKVQALYRP